MQPVNFPDANDVLRGNLSKGITDLHVYKNGSMIVSCYELTGEELMEVLETKRIYLLVQSSVTHHPVKLMAHSPFGDDETEPQCGTCSDKPFGTFGTADPYTPLGADSDGNSSTYAKDEDDNLYDDESPSDKNQ